MAKDKQIIEQEWENFKREGIPADAPQMQLVVMRLAFYAGVWAMLNTAKQLGSDEINENDAVVILDSSEAECQEFAQTMRTDFPVP